MSDIIDDIPALQDASASQMLQPLRERLDRIAREMARETMSDTTDHAAAIRAQIKIAAVESRMGTSIGTTLAIIAEDVDALAAERDALRKYALELEEFVIGCTSDDDVIYNDVDGMRAQHGVAELMKDD